MEGSLVRGAARSGTPYQILNKHHMKTTNVLTAKVEKKMSSTKRIVLFIMSMALMVWIFMLMVLSGASKVGLVPAP